MQIVPDHSSERMNKLSNVVQSYCENVVPNLLEITFLPINMR